MRIAAVIIALLCGIAVLVGIFLPWGTASFLGGHLSFSASGMDVISNSGWDISDFVLPDNLHAVLVLIGAAIMIVSALPALFMAASTKGRVAVIPLGIQIALGAVIAIGGLAWFFVQLSSIDNWTGYVGYGTYICGGGAVLGLIFGVVAAAKK